MSQVADQDEEDVDDNEDDWEDDDGFETDIPSPRQVSLTDVAIEACTFGSVPLVDAV